MKITKADFAAATAALPPREYKRESGEGAPNAKLTQKQADKLRSLAGKLSKTELGKRFGISLGAVRKILLGISYPSPATEAV